MNSNLESKKAVVEEIKNKISSAKAIAFVDYNGLTVDEVNKIRADFRSNNSEYRVYKNRLVMIALKELGYNDITLEGTSAVAFGYGDEVTTPRIISKAGKDTGKIEIKLGIINGKVVDKDTVEKYASIPSKEVLIAKLLSVLNGPARNLAYVISKIGEAK